MRRSPAAWAAATIATRAESPGWFEVTTVSCMVVRFRVMGGTAARRCGPVVSGSSTSTTSVVGRSFPFLEFGRHFPDRQPLVPSPLAVAGGPTARRRRGDPMTETFDQAAVERWLAPRLDADRVAMVDARRPSGQGYSAETVMFTATCERDGRVSDEKLVLRLQNPEPAIYPTQASEEVGEIEIQHRIMSAIAAHSSVPVAPMVGYEGDASVAGRPFFVMRFIEGQVPIEDPSYTVSGFFADAEPAQRRELVANGLRAMARIHEVDWRAAGLQWLVPDGVTPGTPAQVDLWQRFGAQELRGREHPLLARAWTWLADALPEDRSVGLCWGDPRPGNVIFRDFAPVCVTDFEASFIGSPEMDLGWWLMFDRTTHE